jgi:predicted nucleic acid-binding Zn ribbon protein
LPQPSMSCILGRSRLIHRNQQPPMSRLVSCPDCSHPISPDARLCPSCGKDLPASGDRGTMFTLWVWIFAIAIFTAIFLTECSG